MMPGVDIRSRLVVISWWSNCLGLACLHRLASYAPRREIGYVQVGKGETSRGEFRRLAPPQAREIPYPEQAPAEHSRVLQALTLGALGDEYGVWFLDHDLLVEADLEAWLDLADERLSQARVCLCLPARRASRAITQPLFWLSPARWPAGVGGFDPIPFQPRPEARQPGLAPPAGAMRLPDKDTLALAQEALSAQGLVGYFPLHAAAPAELLRLGIPPFPAHAHLGGLSLLNSPPLPESAREWARSRLAGLRAFYAACPPEWLAAEDPRLLQRLEDYEEALHG